MGKSNKINIAYGMMLKRRICQKYNLKIDARTQKRFETFYDPTIEAQVNYDVDELMRKIKGKKPKKFIDKVIEGGCIDFYLTYNKTMSIHKCARYAPINNVGQVGVKSFNSKFADILPEKVESEKDIKVMYENKDFLCKVIPRWLDNFLECDYNVFLQDKEIRVIKKNIDNIVLKPNKITISDSKGYPHISYDGVSIIEIAYVRQIPNIRFNVANVELFIKNTKVKEKEFVRGNLGNATEKAICEVFHIANNIQFNDEKMTKRIMPYIERTFKMYEVTPIVHLGKVTGETKIREIGKNYDVKQYFIDAISGFGNTLHSPIDFYAENNLTISVKTTKSTSCLVCPDTIGQPMASTCTMMLKRFIPDYAEEINPNLFVDIIMERKNLYILIKKYIEYLFLCDYIFYLHQKNGVIQECRLLCREDAGRKMIDFLWEEDAFEYVKSKEDIKYVLNESVSSNGHATLPINYKDWRIGQFDIHKHHNKYLYQFRFNFKNLLNFFEI